MYFNVLIVVVYVFSRLFCSKQLTTHWMRSKVKATVTKLSNNATKCVSFILFFISIMIIMFYTFNKAMIVWLALMAYSGARMFVNPLEISQTLWPCGQGVIVSH